MLILEVNVEQTIVVPDEHSTVSMASTSPEYYMSIGTTSKIDSCGKVAPDILTPSEIEQYLLTRGFVTNNVGQSGLLYYGFTPNAVVTEADVLSGHSHTTNNISNYNVHVTRDISDNTKKYIFVYKEDTLPDIVGFDFNGLTDVWQSATLTVNNKVGKVYRSDNKTFTTDISFNIKV